MDLTGKNACCASTLGDPIGEYHVEHKEGDHSRMGCAIEAPCSGMVSTWRSTPARFPPCRRRQCTGHWETMLRPELAR